MSGATNMQLAEALEHTSVDLDAFALSKGEKESKGEESASESGSEEESDDNNQEDEESNDDENTQTQEASTSDEELRAKNFGRDKEGLFKDHQNFIKMRNKINE